jgi:hypothetical protein
MRHLHLKKEKKARPATQAIGFFIKSSSSSIISSSIIINDDDSDSSKSTMIIRPRIFLRQQTFAIRLAINHLLVLLFHHLFSRGLQAFVVVNRSSRARPPGSNSARSAIWSS